MRHSVTTHTVDIPENKVMLDTITGMVREANLASARVFVALTKPHTLNDLNRNDDIIADLDLASRTLDLAWDLLGVMEIVPSPLNAKAAAIVLAGETLACAADLKFDNALDAHIAASNPA